MKISQTVTELWSVHESLEKIYQRGMEIKEEGAIILVTHHNDLLHISIKLHKISLAVSEL